MTGEKGLLLALVRSALWNRPLPADVCAQLRDLSSSQWRGVLQLARQQSVTGLVYGALQHLPEGMVPPEDILFRLVADADRVIRRSGRLASAQGILLDRLSGFHPLVMKGSVCAGRYPAPELREMGDIDLYMPDAGVREILDAVHESPESATIFPDGSLHFVFQDFDVDIHRHYYDLHGKNLPAPGSEEGELLMLSAHILKHAIGPGVGLRQICDLALALSQVPDGVEKLTECSRRAGIGRWNRLLLSYLGASVFADAAEENVAAGPLARIIWNGGNFGHHSASRKVILEKQPFRRKADTLHLYLSHLPFGIRYAPREYLLYGLDLARGNL